MKVFLIWLGCLWLRSLRVSGLHHESLPAHAIFILWHEHLPTCIRVFSHLEIHVLISKSSDGNWAAEACQKLGYSVHRGSTSRGGSTGMRALARALQLQPENNAGVKRAGMALDGPQGPYRQVKPGSLWLAQFTGTPVIPVYVRVNHGYRLKSWDRCLIPLPFSKVTLFLGSPFLPKNLEEICSRMKVVESLAQVA